WSAEVRQHLRRAGRRAEAGAQVVLNSYWHARKQACPLAGIEFRCLRSRAIGEHAVERAELAVKLVDPRKRGICDFRHGDLARADRVASFSERVEGRAHRLSAG